MKRPFVFVSFLSVLLWSCLLLLSCKKHKKDEPNADFDRVSLLTHLGKNLILPNYKDFQTKSESLNKKVDSFTVAPSGSSLSAAQDAFKEAFESWQKVSVYELGPAADANLQTELNIFPTDTGQINSNVRSGSYDLSLVSNAAAKGFPAIDYLLFGSAGNDSLLLQLYTTDSNAQNRKQYLSALASQIKEKAGTVTTAWSSSGGNYLNTFINASGTDVGSSVGLLINQLNQEIDFLKKEELGIPLGKFSMGTIYPAKTEAYYSGISAQLAVIKAQNILNVYLGKTASSNGIGFDDYLTQINAQYNGGSLANAITVQLQDVVAKLKAIQDPLSFTIQNNPAPVDTAYASVQQSIVLLKTDMPSALGVLITYQDTDGD